ncbi:efflux RND transporter periplasmic adaptor subunit [Sphingobacterium hungaricum]|uniref:Efflux RND transporter periplasmic adaptor subunit n=1 Tax=Sphingobacterium hungaricum TaxID=2082723 RepID=A0A928V091_9SPHI|nr:efflux RND transporter periplasmic adaptor subunit [Sphingobacterium hungaricum]MBE8714309.1 efflux RND transporter periplasmic adaptor subunit [Sphingobacterium hungaricum]
MKTTLYLFGILSVCTVFLAACGHSDTKSAIVVPDTIPVTLMAMENTLANNQVQATGVFTTDDETLLGFKNGGVINKIYVKEGDAVRKGQLLATVNRNEVDAKGAQAKLGVEKAQRDYDRVRKLYLDSVATLEQMQNAKTALDFAKQDLNTVGYNQAYSQIHASVSGYVLAKLANEGQVVGPGTPVLQINGASNANWMLKVGVSDRQWNQIQNGDLATIQSDGLNAAVEAYVFKKSEGLDPQSGTFSIFLKLKDKPENKLASGMFGKATIQTKVNKSEFIKLPYESLLDANANEGYIFITEDGKTAKKVKVQVKAIEHNDVLIEANLPQSQGIIVSGSPYLMDGSFIKITK